MPRTPAVKVKSELGVISSKAPVPAVVLPRSFPVAIEVTSAAFQSEGLTKVASPPSALPETKE